MPTSSPAPIARSPFGVIAFAPLAFGGQARGSVYTTPSIGMISARSSRRTGGSSSDCSSAGQ